MKKCLALFVGLVMVLLGSGCGPQQTEKIDLILATTTSTQDSGLLDAWVPMFEELHPFTVKVIAVGSGRAMEMGRQGECDVMLVHSPAAEEAMVTDGNAISRRAVMHNDFIIAGPGADPAGIGDAVSAAAAFTRIAESHSSFISRGDDSGTHTKELKIWGLTEWDRRGEWYIESGKGMGDTLRIASEEEAYVLTDRATYLNLKRELDLVVLHEGGGILKNFYHVMEVNPEKWPDINGEGARAFSDFVTGAAAQKLLEVFGVERFGEPLFHPDAH